MLPFCWGSPNQPPSNPPDATFHPQITWIFFFRCIFALFQSMALSISIRIFSSLLSSSVFMLGDFSLKYFVITFAAFTSSLRCASIFCPHPNIYCTPRFRIAVDAFWFFGIRVFFWSPSVHFALHLALVTAVLFLACFQVVWWFHDEGYPYQRGVSRPNVIAPPKSSPSKRSTRCGARRASRCPWSRSRGVPCPTVSKPNKSPPPQLKDNF